MDVQDGFIVGIYNYCDRWCETCAFTSRCRAFADHAAMEAAHDSNLKPITQAPPLPQDIPPPPPKWLQELIEELNKAACEPLAVEEIERLQPRLMPEHAEIEERARQYSHQVHTWLERCDDDRRRRHDDPIAVVSWFQYSIPAKIHRALVGLVEDDPEERDWPADHDGSAKVALIGIERSHAAWLQLSYDGLASPTEVEKFIAELIWLTDEIERVFPQARSFVRPGFDEPDEVARLLAEEERPFGSSGPPIQRP